MKRFSISRLEEARKNPAQFGKSLEADAEGTPRNFSKYMAWQLALFKYHKTKNLTETINYFETTYWRNFIENSLNRKQYEEYLGSLNTYIDEHKKSNYVFIDGKVKINLELSNKVKITGQIPIVNLSTYGYSVFFLSRAASNWDEELKFPIVQDFIANQFAVKLKDVEIGVYDLESERHEIKTYSDDDVRRALEELTKIGKIITSNIA